MDTVHETTHPKAKEWSTRDATRENQSNVILKINNLKLKFILKLNNVTAYKSLVKLCVCRTVCGQAKSIANGQ